MVRRKMDARMDAVEGGLQESQSMMQRMEERLLRTIGELLNRRDTNGDGEGSNGGNDGEEELHILSATEGEDRFQKIKLPIFTGEDIPGWIGKFERYFRFQGLNEKGKMEVVFIVVKGKALSWMQWWESCIENPTWDEFKKAVLKRFVGKPP